MSVEFGYFTGTNVVKNMVDTPTKISEYKGKNEFCRIGGNFINLLDEAILTVIDTAENTTIPRHLILGKDACKKVKTLIK